MRRPAIIAGIIVACFFLFIIAMLGMIIAFASDDVKGNVAVIPVKGIILSEDTDSLFGTGIASSTSIIKQIEKADKNPRIEAIVLEINSPGGSAVASDEIGQALKLTNKTKVAWIREIGTSGAYWVASNCDVIISNRMSITGSIGVISSYLDFSGLLTRYNVTYQRLVAGEYKDIGTPYRELTEDEEKILLKQLDEIHDVFIEEVANNRGLTIGETRILANGLFYTGQEAQDKGLVDILGGKTEVQKYLEDKGITPDFAVYQDEKTLLEALAGVFYEGSFFTGRGFAYELKKTETNKLLLI